MARPVRLPLQWWQWRGEEMAEHAAALASDSKEADVDEAEMASRLSKNIAKKFATKRDNSGKPSITK